MPENVVSLYEHNFRTVEHYLPDMVDGIIKGEFGVKRNIFIVTVCEAGEIEVFGAGPEADTAFTCMMLHKASTSLADGLMMKKFEDVHGTED